MHRKVISHLFIEIDFSLKSGNIEKWNFVVNIIKILIISILFFFHCGQAKEECLNENLLANQCSKTVLYVRSREEICTGGGLCNDSVQRQNLFLLSCLAMESQWKKCEGRLDVSLK